MQENGTAIRRRGYGLHRLKLIRTIVLEINGVRAPVTGTTTCRSEWGEACPSSPLPRSRAGQTLAHGSCRAHLPLRASRQWKSPPKSGYARFPCSIFRSIPPRAITRTTAGADPKKAIKEQRATQGMDKDQVLLALGKPRNHRAAKWAGRPMTWRVGSMAIPREGRLRALQ